MATHYGGIGDTSIKNPETHDMDNDSQDNFQEENIVQINLQNRTLKINCRR